MQHKQKAVIFDVDDILLDYTLGIREFVREHYGRDIVGRNTEYNLCSWLQAADQTEMNSIIEHFNYNSVEFGELRPVDGYTVKAMEMLKAKHTDCAFVVVTKSGNKGHGTVLRTLNLRYVFGKDMFDEIVIVEPYESKRKAYHELSAKYDVRLVLDDHLPNIDEAQRQSLPTVVLLRTHNVSEKDNPKYNFVTDWTEMHEVVNKAIEGE